MASKQTSRIRWECPTGEHPGQLGSRRPRRDALIRYCLPCSMTAGVLVERRAPALERQRAAAVERSQAKAAVKRRQASTERERARQRETERFTVEGVDLRDELARYAKLPIFRGTRLARELPAFTVRRHRATPNRRGFAEPWSWRIHLALTDRTSLRSARRTLIHELVHLHVGQVGREWHGLRFQMALRRAEAEAELRPAQAAYAVN